MKRKKRREKIQKGNWRKVRKGGEREAIKREERAGWRGEKTVKEGKKWKWRKK